MMGKNYKNRLEVTSIVKEKCHLEELSKPKQNRSYSQVKRNQDLGSV